MEHRLQIHLHILLVLCLGQLKKHDAIQKIITGETRLCLDRKFLQVCKSLLFPHWLPELSCLAVNVK